MPNDEEINANANRYTTSTANWTVSNLDVDKLLHGTYIGAKPLKKKKGKKEGKKDRQLFRCDWCGKDFHATRKEVNPEENQGYYCIDNPKCKIEGKYGRSMLSKELFELDDEKAEEDVPNE